MKGHVKDDLLGHLHRLVQKVEPASIVADDREQLAGVEGHPKLSPAAHHVGSTPRQLSAHHHASLDRLEQTNLLPHPLVELAHEEGILPLISSTL